MRPLKTFRVVKNIPGAISMTEAVGIYDTIATHLKSCTGVAADLGAHAGKSSIAGAKALLDAGFKRPFYMVDLAYDLDNPEWRTTVQGSADKMPWGYLKDSDKIIKRAMQHYPKCELMGSSSLQFLANPHLAISYVFIDADDHQVDLVMAEVKKLEDIVLPGGLVFFHDFENQYIGPAQAHAYLIDTGKYENISIDWDSAKAYVKKNKLEEGNVSWHMPGMDFPAFVGCARRL